MINTRCLIKAQNMFGDESCPNCLTYEQMLGLLKSWEANWSVFTGLIHKYPYDPMHSIY